MIKESLHHALGYTITDKYREFTDQLISSYQQTGHMGIDEQTALAPITHKRIFKNIDGIKFLNHSGGCGGTREDASTLSNFLVCYADNANVGGVTLLSFGSQHLQIPDL